MKLIQYVQALAFVALAAPMVPASAAVQEDARPAIAEYNLEKGLALGGYDPTAYFPEGGGKPTKGKSKIEAEHRGVTYRFASEKNRELFLGSPEKFEPAYGGWCAYAMAKGSRADIDPKSYLIQDGQLLVFYKGFLNDTRKKWKKEGPEKLRPIADANWQKESGEGAGRSLAHHNLDGALALKGFDPVAYGTGTATAGKQAIAATYEGIEYRFASEASKKTFLAAPASFEAHYGGWCAWAMSQGKKVPVDPEAFVQDEDGLFLFYNAAKRDEWIAARKQMQSDGDAHWLRITGGS